jgi:hypothetical protein
LEKFLIERSDAAHICVLPDFTGSGENPMATEKKKTWHYIYRDAKTGKLVTKEYAEKHPATTVKERVDD